VIRNQNILVAGGAGFIGSHLVDRIMLENPNNIIVVDNLFLGKEDNLAKARVHKPDLQLLHIDASDTSSMQTIAAKYGIDRVFNLAVIPLITSLTYPAWTSRVNYEITLSLCELARVGQISDIVHFSSSEVYGSAEIIPMPESHPLAAITPYASSKAASDLLVRSYSQTFGIVATTVRPFNNYGPRQNASSYAGVIPIVIGNIKNSEPITIHGSGKQTRDFVYVTQTADFAVKAANSPAAKGKTFNLATGKETSVIEIVNLIRNACGKPNHPIVFSGERPGDVLRHCADTSLMQDLFGEVADPINGEFVTETVEWYLK
jgi:UDP-glucose 4-epimerase